MHYLFTTVLFIYNCKKNKMNFVLIIYVQLCCPIGISPWEIRVAFPGESQLWQSRTTQPTMYPGCVSVP